MGKQISIAQSITDEVELINILNNRYHLKCLPKLFTNKNLLPSRLGELDDETQMIFLDTFEEIVLSNIVSLLSNEKIFQVYPYQGLCIEWHRTKRVNEKNFAGRFYLNTEGSISFESEKEIKNIYKFINSYIINNYPFKTPDKFSTYVGPNLSKQINNGKSELNWKNGLSKSIVINE